MLASELPAWFIRLSAFVLGATWGSFFNVAIYRWPREMSVVTPASHCPGCGKPVPGWRNVPIFAYLIQRGRAACCGARMTPRYLLVELLSGVLAIAIAERFIVHAESDAPFAAVAIETVLWFAFVGGLVIATFVDLEWMEIPDEVSVGGTALALATVSWRPSVPIEEVALGAGGGFLVVQILLVWSWERLTGRRGMGEGDSKLAMFIGAFLGWRGALFALVAAAFQGIIGWGIARAMGAKPDARKRKQTWQTWRTRFWRRPRVAAAPDAEAPSSPLDRPIAFGPFLALGALEFLFFGDRIVDWYLTLFE